MVDWLRSEFGGVVIAVLGYVLRVLAENKPVSWRVIAARLVMALIAGIVILAALPSTLAAHFKVGAFLLGGAATPELVRVLTRAALKHVEKKAGETDGKPDL